MVKTTKRIWIITLVLIAIEQGMKLVIHGNYLDLNLPILSPWLYFSPVFNRDYSWLNSMLQLGVGKWVHIVLVSVILFLLYLFYKFLNRDTATTALPDTMFAFIFSGAICSLIDKLFWNGSLDYIALTGFFTFDLKDVYINVFNGLLIFMLLIDYKGLKRVNTNDVIKEFIRYVRRR